MENLEWIPWGCTRTAPRGVETVFHHPLVAIRVKDEPRVRVVNPGDLVSWPTGLEIESWRPMAWAKSGRRGWPSLGPLSRHTAFRGADGHLFHTINAVCEQLFEADSFDDEGAKQWQRLLTKRVEWCNNNNMVYRHLVIPEHHSIYNDMIPDTPPLSEQRPLLRIMNGLESHVRETIVYPLEKMITGREKFDTSMRHDVHFTGYGCFLCYEALIKTLKSVDESQLVRQEELIEREIYIAGDVAHAVGEVGQRVKFHQPPNFNSRAIIKGSSFKSNQVDVYVSDSPSGQTIVIFRTSNSSLLIPYLVRHFSRVVAVATTRVFYDLLLSELPNIVIAEMPERYLAMNTISTDSTIYCSVPNDGANFERETGHVLPLPET